MEGAADDRKTHHGAAAKAVLPEDGTQQPSLEAVGAKAEVSRF